MQDPAFMSPDETHADNLQTLWERDRDSDDATMIIDLELEDLEEYNEIDERDGRDEMSEYELSLE
jgi:hypothetical protein